MPDMPAPYNPLDRVELGKSVERALLSRDLGPLPPRTSFPVVDAIWVALGEAVLIGHYQPLWNGFVQGFGIHAPGSGRDKQARSDWDTLHPGRSFAASRPPRQ